MRKYILGLAALALIFGGAAVASAHSQLLRADPPPNSVLAVSPSTITLWFDEELDPQFSTVALLDTQRNSVDLKNVTFAPDRKQMSVGVRPNLPVGAYTVSWRALSAVDGHITKGVYAIFVGAASAGQAVPLNPANAEASVLPLPLDVLVRWLNLLAALSLGGALTLNLLMADASQDFADLRAASARRLRVWVVINLLVLFVGAIIVQLLQAAAAAERSIGEVLARSIWLQTLTMTRFGQAGLARIVLVDALLIFFALGGEHEWRIKRLWNVRALDLLDFVLGALILLSFSLSSHAASSNDPLRLALLADWLHLLAIGAWTGGLFALTIVLWPVMKNRAGGRGNPGGCPQGAGTSPALTATLLIILRRFSNIAVASVALFALTGLYALWRQVGTPSALVSTPYGDALIIKNLVLVPLLLIGAVNTLLLRPELLKAMGDARVERGNWKLALPQSLISKIQSLSSQLQLPTVILRAVRIESVLGALVVLAAATMTALPPARSVAPPLPPPFEATRQVDNLNISLKVEPYVVGNDTFTVKVTDANGKPASDVQRVNLRFTFLGADLGTTNQEMKPADDGTYKLEGGYLSVVGAWKVETIVRRKNVEDDLRLAYRLNVVDPLSSRAEALPSISSSILFAIFDLIAGTLLLIYARRRNIAEGKWIGVGALALGFVLFLMGTVFAPSASAGILVNPIPPDENSLAQGKAIYEANCVACHGPAGRGNGPLAVSLNPRPADFVQHVNLHSDEVLFNWISQGIPGTAMPAFADKLSENDRWHVLNYIQALVERATSTPAPTPAATTAPTGTSALDVQALLVSMDAAMNQLQSLTEVERLSDDSGHTITTTYQFAAPDKLHFVVSSGMESVAIGGAQYYLEPGKAWEKQARAEPFRWPNFDYASSALQMKFEGEEMIDGERCAVIAVKAPSVDYRFWVGEQTHWMRRQQMDAPGHHMLSAFVDFNAPIVINAPE